MPLYDQILISLTQNKKVVLLYVLESRGSSPGRQGFNMFVTETCEMLGSIGGGIMEHKLVELAKSKLKNNDLNIIFKHQIHSKSVANNQSGMICSGEQSVAIIPLSQKDIPVVQQIVDCLQKGETGMLKITSQQLPHPFQFLSEKPSKPYTFNFINEQNWYYTEKIGYKKFAFIIGGGHVSYALTKVLVDLEFHCTLIDDRAELHTLEKNKYAHQKLILNYDELGQHVRVGNDVFIFIMTFGYRTDLVVLKQLIDKQVAFKGMMGSKEKVKQLMEEMKSLGYSEAQLLTVYSPIGLNIKSRTPHEIAISIAAQIIQLTNKDLL